MKKLLTLGLLIVLFNCKKEQSLDYVTLSGKITNAHESNTLKIFKGKSYNKIITLNADGTFKDTLKLEEGMYSFKHGNQYGDLFLKNGNDTSFETDYNDFDNALKFSGDASDINNLSIQSYLILDAYFTEDLITNANKTSLESAVENYKKGYENLKKEFPNADENLVANIDRDVSNNAMQYSNYITSKIALREAFPKGNVSPTFENYETTTGQKMALNDLKGKYVYMDIWATWCGPCIVEIPHLKALEQNYHDKNIKFVSVSVDDGRGYKGDAVAAKAGWKKMVIDKSLSGTQLIADDGFRSDFIRAYQINSIPRFILIDPDGKIVSGDAPRPSNPILKDLLNGLDNI